MRFIDLANAVLRASGTADGLDSSGVGDPDEFKRQVVDFVRESWVFVQNLHEGWLWRLGTFQFRLSDGGERYDWNSMVDASGARSISRNDGFRNWSFSDPWRLRLADEGDLDGATALSKGSSALTQITLPEWRALKLGPAAQGAGSPQFAIDYDKDILIWPPPGRADVIDGGFIKGTQVFDSNYDEPKGLPEEYHEIIKWRAVMMVHGFDEAEAGFMFAQRQYMEHKESLERVMLPNVVVGSGARGG